MLLVPFGTAVQPLLLNPLPSSMRIRGQGGRALCPGAYAGLQNPARRRLKAFHHAAAPDPEAKRREFPEDRLREARSLFPRAESFAVHELIDPRETRPVLCEWVEWIQPQLDTLVGPTHFPARP